MTRWVIDGTEYEVTPQSKTWTSGAIVYKVRRPKWRPEQHPRDRHGRFRDVGDPVTLLGGTRGTFQGVAADGRLRVRVAGENSDRLVARRHVTFADEPKKPAAKPKPAAAKPAPKTPAPASVPSPPSPPSGQAATGKATLVADSQRNAINDLGIDAPGSPYSQEAQAGAAALRNKKPMTAGQAEALADAVRDAAEAPGIPKTKKNSLNRGAERLNSLSARLRGFDPDKAPTAAQGAEKITPGDVEANDYVALPGPGGVVQVFKVTEASDFYGDFKFVLQGPNGVTETRYVYPDTDVRRFPAANSVHDALKSLDAAHGKPGEPKALYDAPKTAKPAPADLLVDEMFGGPPSKPKPKTAPDLPSAKPVTGEPAPAPGPAPAPVLPPEPAKVPDKGPGAVGPNTMWYDHLTLSGQFSAPIPVSGLTIEGYTVKDGVAWRFKNRTYLVELKPGETAEQAYARGHNVAELMESVLKSAPSEKAALQRGLALLQGNNPSDAYWAKQYNIPGFHSDLTGQFGGTTVWGGHDPKPTDLAHEFGHTVDSQAFGPDQWLSQADGPVVPGQQMSWKQATAADMKVSAFYKDRFKESAGLNPSASYKFVNPITLGDRGVTGYGSVDVREDFAESVRLWMKQRREGRVGTDSKTGENIHFSDLFPERAKVMDAVMGTLTDFDTPARKRRVQEVEDAFLTNLKAQEEDDADPLHPSDMSEYGLPFHDVVKAQVAAHERWAQQKKDEEAKKKAAELLAQQKAAEAAAKAKAEAKVASITAALEAGRLDKVDAKKFRLKVTLYKKKLRDQGYSEFEVAQMAAAYETTLMHEHFQFGAFELPKVDPKFSGVENKAADALVNSAGKKVHALADNQYDTASQAKANIAAELASRLNNPEDWETFRKSFTSSFNTPPEFDSLTKEQRQDRLATAVSARVSTWAQTSGDSDDNAVLMQEAIKQEFGLDAPSAPTMDKVQFETLLKTRWETAGPWYQRVARVMYENTQDTFKAKGIKRISVYRGMGFSSYTGKPTPDWALKNGERRVALQPANSWSTQRSTSVNFASGGHQVMLKASFPVELVLGSALTGFGCLNEQEYVIFDSDGDIRVELL